MCGAPPPPPDPLGDDPNASNSAWRREERKREDRSGENRGVEVQS